MSIRTFLSWLAAGAMVAGAARGGELLAARFHLKPESPYVGEPFEFRMEVEVSPGAELQDVQLEGIALDTVAKIGAYRREDRRQVRRGDTTVDILPFVATGRAMHPTRQEFRGTLHASLVERYNLGFFSSLRTASAAVRCDLLRVAFRPLPTANVPPGFQGAIGTFALSGTMDPPQAAPGDLINLSYAVTGHGWLGDAQVLIPPPGANFRAYPPQETQRDESGSVTLRQVVVPLNTNATRIGMARLPYFDPVAGVYREATAGPFQLAFVTPQAAGSVPAVKHLEVQPNPATVAENSDAALSVTVQQARHLLPFGAVFLLSMLLVGLLYEWRPRVAVMAGLVVLLTGSYLCTPWHQQTGRHGREVRELAAARLCPSGNARVLFQIAPGRQVLPVETCEGWMRVDFDGRYGWIPAGSVK